MRARMSTILALTVWTILTKIWLVDCKPQSLSDGIITAEVLRRLDGLERQGRVHKAELEALREENAQLREANTDLREANEGLVREINNLKERGTELAQRLKTVEERQHVKNDSDLQQPKSGNTEVNEENLNDKLDNKLDGTNNSVYYNGLISVKNEGQASTLTKAHNRIRQSNQESTIAFFATRGASHAEHLGQHQAVLFDQVITNIGQGYHKSTGAFIAPVSGVYVFSTTIMGSNEDAHFGYAINGIIRTYIFVYHTEVYETASQTAIFNLNKGDDVAIHNIDSDKFVHGGGYSTFSGFLLVPTEGDLVVG